MNAALCDFSIGGALENTYILTYLLTFGILVFLANCQNVFPFLVQVTK